jgi:hypothetical protein
VLPPQQPESDPNADPSAPNSALSELQAQLQETQVSLASHVDKIRSLDSLLAEHEVIKSEVTSLRELMEEEKHELEQIRGGRRLAEPRRQHTEDEDGDLPSDDDDAHSIATVTSHELERVEEEDEEQLTSEEEEHRHRRDELTRPRTPEPTGLGMDDEDDKARSRSRSPSPPLQAASQSVPPPPSEDINLRLDALSSQLESALELSRSLQAQHAAAQNTISFLEAKVNTLETLVHASQTQAQTHVAEVTQERASLSAFVNEWKKGVEGQWGGVQEEWAQERARLARARDEWELRVHAVEKGLEGTIARVDAGLTALEQQRLPFPHKQNGSARSGLVTPPSPPRSLSSDSGSGGKSRRKKRSPTSRGRSRSKDGSTSSSEAAHADGDGGSSSASVAAGGMPPNPNPRSRSPWLPEGDSDSDSHPPGRLNGLRRGEGGEKPVPLSAYPITPGPSVREVSSGSSLGVMSEEDAEQLLKAGPNVGPLNPVSYLSTSCVGTTR